MKTCPSCGRHYEDDTLVFCLQDGARLSSQTSDIDVNATLNLPQAPRTQPGPTVFQRPAAPEQSTITSRPEQFHIPARQTVAESDDERPRHSPLPWILAIVLVIGVFGVLIAWIVTRGSGNEVSRNQSAMPMPSVSVNSSTPEATPERKETSESTPDRYATPKATPESIKPKPMFSVMNNTSLDGTRITYYPRPSFAQCQADCAANGNCRGFAWIRPGAYNPGDSAMCYLLSAVTGKTSHPCCIAGVKN